MNDVQPQIATPDQASKIAADIGSGAYAGTHQPKQIAHLCGTYQDDRGLVVEEYRMVAGEYSGGFSRFRVVIQTRAEGIGRVVRTFPVEAKTVEEAYRQLTTESLQAMAQVTANDAMEKAMKAAEIHRQIQEKTAAGPETFSRKLSGKTPKRQKNGVLKFPGRE